jgi:hypothetical protein
MSRPSLLAIMLVGACVDPQVIEHGAPGDEGAVVMLVDALAQPDPIVYRGDGSHNVTPVRHNLAIAGLELVPRADMDQLPHEQLLVASYDQPVVVEIGDSRDLGQHALTGLAPATYDAIILRLVWYRAEVPAYVHDAAGIVSSRVTAVVMLSKGSYQGEPRDEGATELIREDDGSTMFSLFGDVPVSFSIPAGAIIPDASGLSVYVVLETPLVVTDPGPELRRLHLSLTGIDSFRFYDGDFENEYPGAFDVYPDLGVTEEMVPEVVSGLRAWIE